MSPHTQVKAWIDRQVTARNILLHLLEQYGLSEPPGHVSSMLVHDFPWEENGCVFVHTDTGTKEYLMWDRSWPQSVEGYSAYVIERIDSYALLFLPTEKEIKK